MPVLGRSVMLIIYSVFGKRCRIFFKGNKKKCIPELNLSMAILLSLFSPGASNPQTCRSLILWVSFMPD